MRAVSCRTQGRSGRACGLLAVLCLAGCGGVTPVQEPFNRGVYHYTQGNYEEAAAEYRQALEEDPEDHQARLNLAVTLERLAEQAESRSLLEARKHRLRGSEPEAAAVEARASTEVKALRRKASGEYAELLRQRPGDLRASINLAAAAFEEGSPQSGEALLREAMRLHPETALPWTALAAHRAREGRFEEARSLLREAQEKEPASLDVNNGLGAVLVGLGELEAAREAYRRSLTRDPDDLEALVALGRLELQMGRVLEAQGHFQRVLYIHPRCHEAHLRMAEILEIREEGAGAASHLWQAWRLDDGLQPSSGSVDYRNRLVLLYRRLIQDLQEDEPARHP